MSTHPTKVIRIAIIEDNSDVRISLESFFAGRADYSCVGSFESAERALSEIALNLPDVCLVDLKLPGMSGIEFIRKLKAKCPKIHFVVLTVMADAQTIFQALMAGASHYSYKTTPHPKIAETIHQVLNGEAPMLAEIARLMEREFLAHLNMVDHFKLTPRESQVLNLMGKGLPYKEIASELGIALDTAKEYATNVFGKLHARNRQEALRKITPI